MRPGADGPRRRARAHQDVPRRRAGPRRRRAGPRPRGPGEGRQGHRGRRRGPCLRAQARAGPRTPRGRRGARPRGVRARARERRAAPPAQGDQGRGLADGRLHRHEGARPGRALRGGHGGHRRPTAGEGPGTGGPRGCVEGHQVAPRRDR